MPMFSLSRYRYCTVYEDSEGCQFLDEREPFRYSDEPDNVYHTVREGDTWWGLAHRYFDGIPRACGLWWLLCEFQPEPIIDPTIILATGSIVVVPSIRLIRTKVFNEDRKRFH